MVKEYGEFAWFYDRYWGPPAVSWELQLLDKLLLAHLPKDARILDACCGTGHLASALTARGFSVAGVDVSANMIAFAQTNAPAAEFRVMDVRHLDLPARFDAAVCMYDSLNHLTGPEDLQTALAGLHGVLRPGGVLLFDLNTRAALEAWRPVARSDKDAAWIVEPRFDADGRRAVFAFTGFRQVDDQWRRTDVELEQTWFEEEAVVTLLREAQFHNVTAGDAAELLGRAPTFKRMVFRATT